MSKEKDIQTYRFVLQRLRIDQYEDKAVKSLLRTYTTARKQVVDDIKKVIKKGTTGSITAARLSSLYKEIDDVINALNTRLSKSTETIVVDVGEYSYKNTNAIMSWDGIDKGFNNVALSATQTKSLVKDTKVGDKNLDGWLKSIFAGDTADAIDVIKASKVRGVGYKKSLREMSVLYKDMLYDPKVKQNLETIVKTYIQSINTKAHKDIYEANRSTIKEVAWSAIMENGNTATGRGTCPRCMALDGNTYPSVAQGPDVPLHPNCVHPETTVFAPDKLAAFVTTYDGPVVEVTLSDDRRFTVSVNHMFATKNGLVKASLLANGQDIIDCSVSEGALFSYPNNNGYPSSIKEQVEAFSKTPGVVSARVPISSEHLHGDAKFTNGYVDIVTFDSLLRGDFKSFCAEFFGKDGFIDRDTASLNFSAKSLFLFELWRLSDSLSCDVGCFGILPVLFRRTMGHHISIGLSDPTPANTVFGEYSIDDTPGSMESFGNSIFGNHIEVGNDNMPWIDSTLTGRSCKLESDINGLSVNSKDSSDIGSGLPASTKFIKIKNLRTFNYSGHLYDLHCFSGLYTIAGALSSNCRCMYLPVTKTWKELGFDAEERERLDNKWHERATAGVGEKKTAYGLHDGNFAAYWRTKGDAWQNNAVGPVRANLIRYGEIEFGDIIYKNGNLKPLSRLADQESLKEARKRT